MKSIVHPSSSIVKGDVLGIPTFPRATQWAWDLGGLLCTGSQDQRKGSQSGGPGLIRVGRARGWQGGRAKNSVQGAGNAWEETRRPNTQQLSSHFSGLFRKFHGSLMRICFLPQREAHKFCSWIYSV